MSNPIVANASTGPLREAIGAVAPWAAPRPTETVPVELTCIRVRGLTGALVLEAATDTHAIRARMGGFGDGALDVLVPATELVAAIRTATKRAPSHGRSLVTFTLGVDPEAPEVMVVSGCAGDVPVITRPSQGFRDLDALAVSLHRGFPAPVAVQSPRALRLLGKLPADGRLVLVQGAGERPQLAVMDSSPWGVSYQALFTRLGGEAPGESEVGWASLAG